MSNKSDSREFDRFPMELVLEVSAEDIKGNKYKDEVVLNDISGGGAKFMTQQAGKYFPGQLLEMTICLPGTDDVKACMRAKATVVRVEAFSNSGIGEKSQGIGIAVELAFPLDFERLDVETQGNRKKSPENPRNDK